jgi:hypothetical protein
MPGHTIEGLIKLYNAHTMDKELVKELSREFNKNNPDAQPPKAGQRIMIPVLPEYWERHNPKRSKTVLDNKL